MSEERIELGPWRMRSEDFSDLTLYEFRPWTWRQIAFHEFSLAGGNVCSKHIFEHDSGIRWIRTVSVSVEISIDGIGTFRELTLSEVDDCLKQWGTMPAHLLLLLREDLATAGRTPHDSAKWRAAHLIDRATKLEQQLQSAVDSDARNTELFEARDRGDDPQLLLGETTVLADSFRGSEEGKLRELALGLAEPCRTAGLEIVAAVGRLVDEALAAFYGGRCKIYPAPLEQAVKEFHFAFSGVRECTPRPTRST